MPLLEEVARRKAREEEEKRKNSNTLPTKSESSSAEKSANTIKNETVAKTDSHSYRQNSLPVRGNDRNSNRTKRNKRNSYNRHRLDDGARDIQNRALSGQLNADEPTRYITDVHGRTAVDDRIRVNNLDDWFNAGGKFLSNAMDSTIDYSPLGTAYTLASGETLTNGAYYDNPYEEQRQQGLSAGAGRMAGMALNYGIARSAANPLLEKAANAVMNGTKVGALINNSAILGKIGQTVGTNTAKDIATGLVKETISDATLGAGQNALINYAEGLRGRDFWKQMAKDEALDFTLGGIMEGVGIGKQIRNAREGVVSAKGASPKVDTKAEAKPQNVGYHAGDLGKSEWHSQQAGGTRNSGAYGTGTYFVGDSKLVGEGTAYGDRPLQTVDFDGYNLYRPKDSAQGERLHENLRRINKASGNLSKLTKRIDATDESISTMRKVVDEAEEYTEANLKKIQEIADDVLPENEINDLVREAKERAKPKTRSDEEYLELAQDYLRDENKTLDEYGLSRPAGEEKARLKELEDIIREQDKKPQPYEKYYFNLLSDKLSKELNGDVATGTSKYLDDLESSKNIISQLAEDTGKSEAEVRKALEAAKEKISKYSGTNAKEDSASTIVMKELGFEGVDVRGIEGLDNTFYGSVIYDLKKQTPDIKAKNKPKGSALEAEADAKSWEDFSKTPSKEAKAEFKAKGMKPDDLKELWRNRKMQGFTRGDAKELTKEAAADILNTKMDRGVAREWFTNYDSNIKPKIEDAILNDKELRNAGLNLAYHNFKEFDFKGTNKDISFDEFLDTPITLYRGKHSKGLIDDDTFVSFTPDLETARHLGDKGEEIIEITVTPRETFGTYDINGEQEYFVPRKLYDEQTPKVVETNSAKAVETPKAGKTGVAKEAVDVSSAKEEQILTDYQELSMRETPTADSLAAFSKGDYNASEAEAVLRKNGLLEDTPKVDSPDSTAYNNVKGEETNGRKDTQPLQEGNLQQGTAKSNSGSESVLQGERPRNAGDIRVESEGRSRASGDVQVSEGDLVDEATDKVLKTDGKIPKRTAKRAENIEEFAKRLDENRAANEYGCCVSPVDPKNYDKNTRYFTTHEGQVTCGVEKNGNIVALSKSSNASSKVNSHEALMTAFGMGGNRADAYGIRLANIYQRYGLVPVARVPFDENVVREYFRPEEVDNALATFGKMKDVGNDPDVFFFAKFDDLENTIKTRENGGYKALTDDELRNLPEMDYDSAEKYRNELLDNSSKRNAYMKEHGISGTFTEAKATTAERAKRPAKRLGKEAETVADNTKPQVTAKATNSGSGLPKGGKIEKVGEFEVVGGGKGVETTTPSETKLSAIERFKKNLRNARRDLINSEAGIERMDKVAKQTKIQEKSYMTRNAKGQVGYILNKKLVNREGKEIGKSLSDVLGGKIEYNGKTYDSPFKDKATAKLFDEYAMELHNVYRAKQGKNIYGGRDYVEEVDQIIKHYPALADEKDRLLKWLNDTDGTTSKEQRKALEERLRNKYSYEVTGKDGKKEIKSSFDDVIKDLNKYRAAKSQANVDRILDPKNGHPEFAKITEEMDKWWDSFTDEYLVKSGIISAENVKKFKEIYPHYVPTFRDMGELAGKESKNAATLVKKATGSGKRQLLTVPEQYAHQIDRIVTAARRNELNQEIINTISKDPAGMKAFGAIQDGKGKLTYDFSKGDLDDFITTLDDISLNQIKSGKNTITAVFNGEKVTANISDEVAKSLEAMSNIQDTNLLVKVGKTITNPMKFTITGGNPVFFISNMMRDLPTLYIQSQHGMLKTTTGLFKATKEVFTNGEKYRMYKALGGAEAGYYMRGKGFETSASTRGVIKRVQEVMSFLGEKGEAIPRLAEFINTLEKTGDAYKALRDAAESTVDFSRKGSSDVAKALDAWTLYLNAGLQGLDKFARTVAAHPLRTAGRSATMLGIPYMALTALNQDNPYYQELTERVKQNNFLIPNIAGEKDEDGNCKTFIKVPLNREYGTVFATSLYCALKAVKGEDDSWKGFGETFQENFLPNNPFTDNILAPLLINIPQNKDFAGRSIVPNSLKDASPENQYDYDTSEFAKLVSKGMNKIPVKDVPIVKYLQSPKLVDYILDSYTGYYGKVLQSATTTGGTSKDNYVKDVLAKQTAAQPFLNKFVADSRYSSKPVEDFYNMKDEYTQQKTDAEIEGKTWSEAHAAEHALSTISKGLYESTQAEKEILADKSLTKAEKDKMIAELRTARNKLAKEANKTVQDAIDEYKEAPTFSELSDSTKEKWGKNLGISKEKWATAYNGMIDEYDSRGENTSKMTTDEKRLYLLEHGITTYPQAQSILGKSTSKDEWDNAVEAHKNGQTYKSLKDANIKTAERQRYMTDNEKKIDNRLYSKYDGETISEDLYNKSFKEFARVDKLRDDNGSITQDEAINAIENLDQMYGLTQEQKSYLWYLIENVNSKGEGWKRQPYGKWNG